MRVMHVVLGLNIGGLEAIVLDLARTYADSVTSIIVCLRSGTGAVPDNHGARIIELNGPDAFSLSLVRRLTKIIREENIDLVHTHNQGPHLYGALAARLCGRPTLHTKHGRNYLNRREKRQLNRIGGLLSNRVVAVSEDAANVCREIGSIPERKLCTIVNGVDPSKFVPVKGGTELRQQLCIADGVPIIGIVARLSGAKNHGLLFESMAELRSWGIDASLCVVGDGPLRDQVHARAAELDLGGCVHFLGARKDVDKLIPQFDVFALSSITEGVSLTLLEAMSCEVPVVATRVGGNPEVIEDGVSGLIVEQQAAAMAHALAALLQGSAAKERRRAMGKAGRERVLRLFSIENTAKAYLYEYGNLLPGSQPGVASGEGRAAC